MIRPLRVLLVLSSFGLAVAACNKAPDAQAVPVPSGSAAASASAAPSASASAPATATAPVHVPAMPIDACCAALDAVSKSGRGADAKAKSAQAASICHGFAAKVTSGATTRASALGSIHAQLAGIDTPPECR